MTPLSIIRKKLVQEPNVLDLEAIGARMEHHKLMISVDNMFSSDTGDRWRCRILDEDTGERVQAVEPSIRTAIIKALKRAEEWQSNNREGKQG